VPTAGGYFPRQNGRTISIMADLPTAFLRSPSLERLESSTIFESVVIVAQLTFSLPLHLPKSLGW
jgi:hypothetical protein